MKCPKSLPEFCPKWEDMSENYPSEIVTSEIFCLKSIITCTCGHLYHQTKTIYCGDGVPSTFLAVMWCSAIFFVGVAVFRGPQCPPLLWSDTISDLYQISKKMLTSQQDSSAIENSKDLPSPPGIQDDFAAEQMTDLCLGFPPSCIRHFGFHPKKTGN